MPIKADKEIENLYRYIKVHCPETYPEKLKELAKKRGVHFYGKGAEVWVFGNDKNQPKIAFALARNDLEPLRAKKIYYVQKILSTLFPHNFPKFYSAFSESKDRKHPAGTARQAIDIRDIACHYYDLDKRSRNPFCRIIEVCEQLHLRIGVDTGGYNFALGKDGSVYYLDTVSCSITREALERILVYMQNHGYSKDDIKTVAWCGARLFALEPSQKEIFSY